MDTLKSAVVMSPAICPLDYSSINKVILAVDSSHIVAGYILSQMDNNRKRRPARFSSIMWNEHKSRYSQAKLELYGLFRALKVVKVWIIGVKNFTVEVDAQYIKGMLINPDIQPNALMNHWLAGIQTFDFKLQHVSASKHQGPDGYYLGEGEEKMKKEKETKRVKKKWSNGLMKSWDAGYGSQEE